jgi:hypothetical protein
MPDLREIDFAFHETGAFVRAVRRGDPRHETPEKA